MQLSAAFAARSMVILKTYPSHFHLLLFWIIQMLSRVVVWWSLVLEMVSDQYACSTYLSKTGLGVVEIGKAVSTLLCHALAPQLQRSTKRTLLWQILSLVLQECSQNQVVPLTIIVLTLFINSTLLVNVIFSYPRIPTISSNYFYLFNFFYLSNLFNLSIFIYAAIAALI